MQFKYRLHQVVLAVVGVAFAPFALALGTPADQAVTNSVTMSYQVNAINQTATTSVSFEVDRKYLVDVTTSDTNWVTAVPGQDFASGNFSSLRFTVRNDSNDTVGIRLALLDQGATQISGGDPWDPVGAGVLSAAGLTVWEDNGDGTYNAVDDEIVGTATGILNVLSSPTFAPNESRDYYVTVDVDGTDAADLFSTFTLVAAVADATGTNVIATDDSGNATPGTAPLPVVANDINAVENVFAESASGNAEDVGYNYGGDAPSGAQDADFDGQASDSSGFRTRIALGVSKHVEVLWDPVTGNKYTGVGNTLSGNSPKAIPGAVMLYVIGVRADSGVNATTVLIDDDIPETLTSPGTAQAGIVMPDTVDININGSPVTFDLDATIAADGDYHTVACGSVVVTTTAFAAASPEIDDANLGDCDGQPTAETGYVVYVVTVDDT